MHDIVSWQDLVDAVRPVLGAGPAANLASEAIVEAEALGQTRFGLRLLERARVRGSSPQPDAPSLVRDRPGRAVLAAEDVPGPIALATASLLAADKAAACGVGVVAITSLGGSGRLASYATWLASQGMVGLVVAGSAPAVAPFGGGAPALGTNPFAVAMPAQQRPVVVDTATSAMTLAELREADARGQSLPLGTGLDVRGRPTTEATDVESLLPRDGLMGTLAALLVESLTSGVTGQEPTGRERSGTVIAIEADGAVADDLRRRIVRAGGRMPGDATQEALEHARARGVRLSAAARAALEDLSAG